MKDLAVTVLSLAFVGLLWLLLAGHQSGSKKQPVAYNHKKHIALGLECAGCHTGIADGKARGGLPTVEVCAACHTSDDENPRAKAVRDYVSANKPIPWKKVYNVPTHVYFSHRRHVGLAKLDCALCHGDMSKVEAPVTRQAVTISMARCMGCHHRMKVTNDCMACHK
ncbi:MAG: cytochrome c3 family protein [Elusimicrobia bacterium]|nr:cytochrome c3 family protein [Elusimicrobiota bacterium]